MHPINNLGHHLRISFSGGQDLMLAVFEGVGGTWLDSDLSGPLSFAWADR